MNAETVGDVEDLEGVFGNPTCEQGSFTHDTIVRADIDRGIVNSAALQLDEWGFAAEFVPVSRGGRWASTEDLVRRLLPIFRRDPSLGLGHGITSLMGAANVWVAGDEDMQSRVAKRLLAGERIAVGFHELSHGNDLIENECMAVRVTEPTAGWRVDGRKEVINNIDRAESVLLFVRTDPESGPRGFSLLLWHKDETRPGRVDTSRRLLTSGMRGCLIGAVEIDGLVLPAESLVGDRGAGVMTALRAFQITRSVIPALAAGIVDAAIRLSVGYARDRSLYGASVWDLPHARTLVVRAWAALLVADSFARAVVRTLHLRPDETFLASAASKYLVPLLLNGAMEDLSTLFGSNFYAISPPYGIFEKWLRDLVVVPIGHAGSTSCLLTLIPNLPTWARRSRRDNPYDPRLFSTDSDFDQVDFGTIGVSAGRVDSLTAPLRSEIVLATFRAEHPTLVVMIDAWARELDLVRDDALALPISELGSDASVAAFDIAKRLTAVMAAGSVLGTWFEGRSTSTSPFSDGDVAITAALDHLSSLLRPRTAEESRTYNSRARTQVSIDAAAAHLLTCVDTKTSLGTEELPVA
jgi:alkylation response protein AidB-like acyl-CoA dehydrogenase